MYAGASKSTIGYFTVMTEACAHKLMFPHLTSSMNMVIRGFKKFPPPPIFKLHFPRSKFWGLSILSREFSPSPILKLHFLRKKLWALSILSCEFSKYNISGYTRHKALVCIFWKCQKSRRVLSTYRGLEG